MPNIPFSGRDLFDGEAPGLPAQTGEIGAFLQMLPVVLGGSRDPDLFTAAYRPLVRSVQRRTARGSRTEWITNELIADELIWLVTMSIGSMLQLTDEKEVSNFIAFIFLNKSY